MNILKKINFVCLFLLSFLIEINQIQAKEPINFNSNITINNNPDRELSNVIIMQQGDGGENVRRLQEKLKKLGLFDSEITGYFGNITEEAVRNFQEANGIIPTGKVDKITSNLLFGSTYFYSNNDDFNDEEPVENVDFGTIPLPPPSNVK